MNGVSIFNLASVLKGNNCICWYIGSIISKLPSCEKQIFDQFLDVRIIYMEGNVHFLEWSGKCPSRGVKAFGVVETCTHLLFLGSLVIEIQTNYVSGNKTNLQPVMGLCDECHWEVVSFVMSHEFQKETQCYLNFTDSTFYCCSWILFGNTLNSWALLKLEQCFSS